MFVHQSVIKSEGFRSLAVDEPVEFEVRAGCPTLAAIWLTHRAQVETDDMGRQRASKVTGPAGADVKGAPKREFSRGGDRGADRGDRPPRERRAPREER